MSPGPVDRREFLAAGGGGLLLCTLGGQQILSNREADIADLNSKLEVPPKVAAARSQSTAAQPEPVLAAARANGTRREYWIKAVQRRWNIVPKGRDQMLGKKVKGPTKFKAFAYRAYTQNFETPIGGATIPGPLIDARSATRSSSTSRTR